MFIRTELIGESPQWNLAHVLEGVPHTARQNTEEIRYFGKHAAT